MGSPLRFLAAVPNLAAETVKKEFLFHFYFSLLVPRLTSSGPRILGPSVGLRKARTGQLQELGRGQDMGSGFITYRVPPERLRPWRVGPHCACPLISRSEMLSSGRPLWDTVPLPADFSLNPHMGSLEAPSAFKK